METDDADPQKMQLGVTLRATWRRVLTNAAHTTAVRQRLGHGASFVTFWRHCGTRTAVGSFIATSSQRTSD